MAAFGWRPDKETIIDLQKTEIIRLNKENEELKRNPPVSLDGELAKKIGWLKSNIAILYQRMNLKKGNCKACNKEIWWVYYPTSDKWSPHTDEALNHFADCPRAEEFR